MNTSNIIDFTRAKATRPEKPLRTSSERYAREVIVLLTDTEDHAREVSELVQRCLYGDTL